MQILHPVRQPDPGGWGWEVLATPFFKTSISVEGRSVLTALPMEAVLCSPMGVPVDAPQLTASLSRQLDQPCPQKASSASSFAA